MSRFEGFYKDKVVMVTGHTGFKGSWLALWLKHLGATVVGYALDPPTEPNHLAAASIDKLVTDVRGDVRDHGRLEAVITDHRPEVIFHLAAQPLVLAGYRDPRSTFDINMMGTVNVLEAARNTDSVKVVVVVTSDKCYKNLGWAWPYRENDVLGGADPYSASKACAELIVAAYQSPEFRQSAEPNINFTVVSARAGNVIGGGDWALDRIIPDTVRAITMEQDLVVRYPEATRPWQHVLEPLSGYLQLGAVAGDDPARYGSAWNFGPAHSAQSYSVAEVVEGILQAWPAPKTKIVVQSTHKPLEKIRLMVDSSKAVHGLDWAPAWDFQQTTSAVVEWYRHFYSQSQPDMQELSLGQIEAYTKCAKGKMIRWTTDG